MRRFLLAFALLAWVPPLWNPVWGQAPRIGEKSASNKKQNTALTQSQPETDRRGTKDSPLIIDPKGHKDTPEEAAQSKADEDYKRQIDRWTIGSAISVAVLTGLLVIVGWRGVNAANRTLWEINRQADLMEQQLTESRAASAQQSAEVKASIAEATRAATAMEGIATSMASNVESVRESVGISREIADMQKLATELQSRAYLSVSFQTAIFQDANHPFEAHAILKNHGNTPAYDVTFRAASQIVPVPLPEDFAFPLPDSSAGGSVSLMAPGTMRIFKRSVSDRVPDDQIETIKRGCSTQCLAMWGIVTYRDAFKEMRNVRFAFTVNWIPWVPGFDKDKDGNPVPPQIMSYDTARHNDAT